MHSGVEVEAFQTALNKDIGGDTSTSHPSASDANPGIHPISFDLFIFIAIVIRCVCSYDICKNMLFAYTFKKNDKNQMFLGQLGSS